MAAMARMARAVSVTLAIGLLVAGCSAGSSGPSAGPDRDKGTSPAAGATAPGRTVTGSARPTPHESSQPTLPPGDPGVDAPGTDDPNAAPTDTDDDSPSTPARDTVPREALLDAPTVASMTGSAWTSAGAPTDSCTAPRAKGAVAQRGAELSGGAAGRVVERVATHRDGAAAIRAVRALQRRLAGCGDLSSSDPRLGDASVQATLTSADGTKTLITAVAADGVTAVLAGTGPVTHAVVWASLTDLALGNTCAAAAEGCH
jgi:hypothetical protein